MYCDNCGFEIEKGMTYCKSCYAPVDPALLEAEKEEKSKNDTRKKRGIKIKKLLICLVVITSVYVIAAVITESFWRIPPERAVVIGAWKGYLSIERAVIGTEEQNARREVKKAFEASSAAYRYCILEHSVSTRNEWNFYITVETMKRLGKGYDSKKLEIESNIEDGIISVTYNGWKYNAKEPDEGKRITKVEE